jgi:transposase InsO family protein
MPWKEKEVVTLREEFVLKALGGSMSFSDLCKEYNISRKTGYKWLGRFRERGLTGLKNESTRPHTSPDALSEQVVCALVRIKRSAPESWGPKKVLRVYQRDHNPTSVPSLSSVKRVLDKAGFVNHRRRRRSSDPARPQERIKPERPNELWTVDFKGWWKTRDGERCEPLTLRDGYSRYILDIRALQSTSNKAVRPVFESVFEHYGLPEMIRSDNGSPFASVMAPLGLSQLSAWWVSLGIRLDRIDPGRPDQNGAHERIHRDIRADLQSKPTYKLGQSQELFDEWRHTFNWQRPHEALEMNTPAEYYTPSDRIYSPSHVDIIYPPEWLERRVSSSGSIKLCNRHIGISGALSGFVVGLQPVNDRLDVWFDYLRLGHIDLHVMKFNAVTGKRKTRPRPLRVGNHAVVAAHEVAALGIDEYPDVGKRRISGQASPG